MAIDADQAGKPIHKLLKLLNDLPPAPSPQDVHSLRTQTRRLEATLHALSPEIQEEFRPLIKLMKPLRKAAGRVRDVDVHIAKASSIVSQSQPQGSSQFLQILSGMRKDRAERLHREVMRRRGRVRRRLKQSIRLLESVRRHNPSAASAVHAAPPIVAAGLDRYPRLQKENLHAFRKRLRMLQYVLQIVPEHDPRLISAVVRVKELTGEWHDWLELNRVAEKVLDPRKDAPMLAEIRTILKEKLRLALTAANSLRKRALDNPIAA